MSDVYYRHVIPEPQILLGLELKPFCAGHIALLHRTQNVFVTGGTVDITHLSAAIFICAQTFQQGVASLNDPGTQQWMFDWGKKVSPINLLETKLAFEDYIARGSEFTLKYVPKESRSSAQITQLPTVHRVRCALKHFYHVTEPEFWDMPWGLALYDYFTIPVINGIGDLVEAQRVEDLARLAQELHDTWEKQMRKAKPKRSRPRRRPAAKKTSRKRKGRRRA